MNTFTQALTDLEKMFRAGKDLTQHRTRWQHEKGKIIAGGNLDDPKTLAKLTEAETALGLVPARAEIIHCELTGAADAAEKILRSLLVQFAGLVTHKARAKFTAIVQAACDTEESRRDYLRNTNPESCPAVGAILRQHFHNDLGRSPSPEKILQTGKAFVEHVEKVIESTGWKFPGGDADAADAPRLTQAELGQMQQKVVELHGVKSFHEKALTSVKAQIAPFLSAGSHAPLECTSAAERHTATIADVSATIVRIESTPGYLAPEMVEATALEKLTLDPECLPGRNDIVVSGNFNPNKPQRKVIPEGAKVNLWPWELAALARFFEVSPESKAKLADAAHAEEESRFFTLPRAKK